MKNAAYVLVLFRESSRYGERGAYADAHADFVTSLIRRNLVLLGGDFGETVESFHAAYLIRSESVAAARLLVADDPFFANGVFEPDVVEWQLVGVNPEAVAADDVVTPRDV